MAIGGFLRREDAPSVQEHKKLEKRIAEQRDRIDGQEQLLHKCERTLTKLESLRSSVEKRLDATEKSVGAFEATLSTIKKAWNGEINKVHAEINKLNEHLTSAGYEKEVSAMFHRQFARFDSACKSYADAKTQLHLASNGVFQQLEHELQKHVDTGNKKLEDFVKSQTLLMKEDFALQNGELRALIEESQSQFQAVHLSIASFGNDSEKRVLELGEFKQNILAQIEEQRIKQEGEVMLMLRRRKEEFQASLTQTLTAVQNVADGALQSERGIAAQVENLVRLQAAMNSLRGPTLSAFWKRLAWLFLGKFHDDLKS